MNFNKVQKDKVGEKRLSKMQVVKMFSFDESDSNLFCINRGI